MHTMPKTNKTSRNTNKYGPHPVRSVLVTPMIDSEST